MLSIVYSSKATEAFEEAHLVDVLLRSRRNNRRLALSGMLIYRDGYFLQAIEGPEAELRERMTRIADDPRHSDIAVLLEEMIDERMFPAWTMGFQETDAEAGDPAPGLQAVFDDIAAGRDPVETVPSLREVIRGFQTALR